MHRTRSVLSVGVGVALVVLAAWLLGNPVWEWLERAFGPPPLDTLTRLPPRSPLAYYGLNLGFLALLLLGGGLVTAALASTRRMEHAAITGLVAGLLAVTVGIAPGADSGAAERLAWAAPMVVAAIAVAAVGGWLAGTLPRFGSATEI